MGLVEPNDRLSQIRTSWVKLFQAHQGQGDARIQAQQQQLLRYHGAVYRYLFGTVSKSAENKRAAEDLATDLTNDFAVHFLRGDFRGAAPERGRFRDYLKAALRHLVVKYWEERRKRKTKGPHSLPDDSGTFADERRTDDGSDAEFLTSWREELLARAWAALAKVEEETGVPCYTVLRCNTDRPGLRSAQLAEELAARLGKPFTEDAVRQALHRARKKFAGLLVEEVAWSLSSDDPDALEQELIELSLLDYCRSALQQHKRRS